MGALVPLISKKKRRLWETFKEETMAHSSLCHGGGPK